MTSSPGPIPSAFKATSRAEVPEFTATACLTPRKRAIASSKALTLGPWETHPDRKASRSSRSSSSPKEGEAHWISMDGQKRSSMHPFITALASRLIDATLARRRPGHRLFLEAGPHQLKRNQAKKGAARREGGGISD